MRFYIVLLVFYGMLNIDYGCKFIRDICCPKESNNNSELNSNKSHNNNPTEYLVGGRLDPRGVYEAPGVRYFFNQIWLSTCQGDWENIKALTRDSNSNEKDKYVFSLYDDDTEKITVTKNNNSWEITKNSHFPFVARPEKKTWAIVSIEAYEYEVPAYFYIDNISSVDHYFGENMHYPYPVAAFKDMSLKKVTFLAANIWNVKTLETLFSFACFDNRDESSKRHYIIPEKRKKLLVEGLNQLNVENVEDFRYMFDNDKLVFNPNELAEWKPKKDVRFYHMFFSEDKNENLENIIKNWKLEEKKYEDIFRIKKKEEN